MSGMFRGPVCGFDGSAFHLDLSAHQCSEQTRETSVGIVIDGGDF